MLAYFGHRTEHELNFYNLSPKNYRLWLAIKVLAGKDTGKYARSVSENTDLFTEFYKKARQLQIKLVENVRTPTA